MSSVIFERTSLTRSAQGKRRFQDYAVNNYPTSAHQLTERPNKFLRLTEDAPFDPEPTCRQRSARTVSSWLWLSPEVHPSFAEKANNTSSKAPAIGGFLSLVPEVHPQYKKPTKRKVKTCKLAPQAALNTHSRTRFTVASSTVVPYSADDEYLDEPPPEHLPPYRPTWWYPEIVRKQNFHTESGLLLVGYGQNPFASIMPTYELFRAILVAAVARREANSSWIRHGGVIDDIKQKYTATAQDSDKCLDAIKDFDLLFRSEDDPQRREWFMKRRGDYVQRIDVNNAEIAKLEDREDKAVARHEQVLDQTKASEDALWVLLSNLLVKIGVLPSTSSINNKPPVLVEDANESCERSYHDWPEDNWNDEVPGEWKDTPAVAKGKTPTEVQQFEDPENTWNNAWEDYPMKDPLIMLRDRYTQKAQEANRVEVEFNQIRDRYKTELDAFLFHRRSTHPDLQKEPQQLEEEFGPIWLQKCRDMTGKFKEADKEYEDASQALSDANRRDRATKRDCPEIHTNQVAARDETTAPQQFKDLLPRRKRRLIKEWCEDTSKQLSNEEVEELRRNTDQRRLSIDIDVPSNPLHSGGEDVPIATGHKRRKIDRFKRRNEGQWPDTSDDALQAVHLAWAREVGEHL